MVLCGLGGIEWFGVGFVVWRCILGLGLQLVVCVNGDLVVVVYVCFVVVGVVVLRIVVEGFGVGQYGINFLVFFIWVGYLYFVLGGKVICGVDFFFGDQFGFG